VLLGRRGIIFPGVVDDSRKRAFDFSTVATFIGMMSRWRRTVSHAVKSACITS
jgi:hypothetical protein